MSHFKYEINERNLKLQLKENQLAFSEEAWQKFESFSETHKSHHREDVMKRFNISLNRNVVLPLVFGAIIVLFSLLLFNFVNIKNPSQETADIKQQLAAPASVKKEIQPQKKETSPVASVKNSVDTAKAKSEIENPDDQANKATAEKLATETDNQAETSQVVVASPKIVVTPAKSESNIISNTVNQPIQAEVPQKRKHKKRELIATEPTAEEDSQLPPPVSQASSSGQEMK